MDILLEKVSDFIILLLMKLIQLFGGKNLFSSPKTIETGVLGPGEVEIYHSLSYVQQHIWQDERNTLIIGSPHMKYWFETADEPRMLDFLKNTISLKVSVCYYQGPQSTASDLISRGMSICKEKFPERFSFVLSEKTTSISYIAYKFQDKKRLYSRCLVGFQEANYRARPFIEFVEKEGDQSDFVEAIMDFHKRNEG